MRKYIKILLLAILVSATALGVFVYGRSGESNIDRGTSQYQRLKLKADSAQIYSRNNGFNARYCFSPCGDKFPKYITDPKQVLLY